MLRFTLASLLLIAFTSFSDAGPLRRFRTPTPAPAPAIVDSGSGLAQQKAEQQAREGVCRHVGGGFGAGTHEGVGYSTVSADDAIRHCCYWGVRQPIDIGVARGANGWHACVIYR